MEKMKFKMVHQLILKKILILIKVKKSIMNQDGRKLTKNKVLKKLRFKNDLKIEF